MKPKEFDTIRLLVPLADQGVDVGNIGVILAVFDNPDVAYEVEFSDQDGALVAQAVLKEGQFEVVSA